MKHALKVYWQNKLVPLFRGFAITPLIGLLLVGATLSLIANDEYRQTQDFEFRLLEAHARNTDVQIAGVLRKIDRLLRRIADERPGMQPSGGDTFVSTANVHRKDFPEIGTLLITDAAGHIRSATDAAMVGQDVSREPYFAVHLDRTHPPKLFMSRPGKNLLGTPVMTFTFPIVGTDQKFLGMVGATVGFKFLPTQLEAINPDDSASMSVIVNRDGDIVYRRDEPQRFFGFNIAKVSTVLQAHFRARLPVTRHIGPSVQNGKTRLFLIRDVGDTGLSLILSRQLDDVLGKWQRNVLIYALIFLFSFAVVIFLAISAARRKQLESEVIESQKHLRAIEHQKTLAQERQRLMQDMHDGMGSSLNSALRVVEHGRMDADEVAEILKDCLDDLKLTIDSMEPVEADLLLLLATLRYRLEPRMESSGIVLRWEVQLLPKLDWLDPRNALHILRILQEAFTNVIKHAQASEILVATGIKDDHVTVTIADNGRGFDTSQAPRGRDQGLVNQTRRAASIGAEIQLTSSAAGTHLTLRLPIRRSFPVTGQKPGK